MTIDKTAICPFFCEIHAAQYDHAEIIIKCEAPVGFKSLFMTLGSPKKKKEYLTKHCCSFEYIQCPVARMLLSTKYGEGAD